MRINAPPRDLPFSASLLAAMRRVFLLLAAAVLLAVVAGSWLGWPAFQYLYYYRIPVLMGLVLLALPVLATQTGLSSMLGNLFVLRGRLQPAMVVVATLMLGGAVVLLFDVLLGGADGRFGLGRPLEEWLLPETWWWAAAFVLALPVLVVAWRRTTAAARADSPAALREVRQGFGLGLLVSAALSLASYGVLAVDLLRPIRSLLEQTGGVLGPGYVSETGVLVPGHERALAFLAVAAAVYWVSVFLWQPRLERRTTQAPALFFLFVLLMVAGLFLGGTAFFLDRYHLPVVTLLALASLLIHAFFRADHYFLLREGATYPAPEPADLREALRARLADQPEEGRTVVVVCASGGGIQAAAWTAQVLTGLHDLDDLGPDFTKAIGLISAVSGGSVGTMYYLDDFGPGGVPRPEKEGVPTVFDRAARESLDATGWGLAYPDLWSGLGFLSLPRLLTPRTQDRGWAIEVDWAAELRDRHARLGTWRERILKGELPVPVFNATLVEDGRRFLLSPMAFVPPEGTDGPTPLAHMGEDFFSLFDGGRRGYDLDVTTAARLSATFPYVTPTARALPSGLARRAYLARNLDAVPGCHVADGGYFDNFGVFTGTEWLDYVLADASLQIDRVLFLEIHAFPDPTEAPEVSYRNSPGWLMTLLGPLLTLANVRTSSQSARNLVEVAGLHARWPDVEIEHVVVSFPQGEKPPLSWKLTQQEKQEVQAAWQQLLRDPDGPIHRISRFWQARRRADAS